MSDDFQMAFFRGDGRDSHICVYFILPNHTPNNKSEKQKTKGNKKNLATEIFKGLPCGCIWFFFLQNGECKIHHLTSIAGVPSHGSIKIFVDVLYGRKYGRGWCVRRGNWGEKLTPGVNLESS